MGSLETDFGAGVELRPTLGIRRREAAREARALEGGRCSGGGGGSSSSSSQTTQNIDRRQVVAEGGVGISSDTSTITVHALDSGAVAKSFEFAQKVAEGGAATGQSLIGLTRDVFTRSFETLKQQQAFVSAAGEQVAAAYSEAKGDATQKFILAIGVAALVSVISLRVIKP